MKNPAGRPRAAVIGWEHEISGPLEPPDGRRPSNTMNLLNTFIFYPHISNWIACLTFFAAFVLTLVPNAKRVKSAAVLYCFGLLARLIYLAVYNFSVVTSGSNGSSADVHPTMAIVCSVWALVYATAAVWLLWPSIPQARALFLGKLLHLVILPPLVLWLSIGLVNHSITLLPYDLTWLVYALLWFRIREAYAR